MSICQGLLEQPGACLWITPEGDFTDVRTRPVALAPGLAHLAKRTRGAIFLPIAVEYAFWNEKKPEALVQVGEPLVTPSKADGDVEYWTAKLTAGLEAAMDQLAQKAMARDPAAFDVLIGGRTGVGFFYDSWRRFKAWTRGRRFSKGHEGSSR